MALKVLNEYYSGDAAHGSAGGSSTGIISLLETVESDFSRGLAEEIATEGMAAHEYEVQTQENKKVKTMKDADLKYKTKEHTSLDKTVGELKSDREGVQTELDATLEYAAKIDQICI